MLNEVKMIITFFGHSNFIANEFYKKRVFSIFNEIVNNNHVEFYLGGYGAFDSFAFTCAKEYKNINGKSTLSFISPYLTISYQKNHLNYQKEKYDNIIYPNIEDKPPKFAIHYRNRYMVKNADVIIVYITHQWGGAYQAYKYAKSLNKTIFNIAEK